MLLHDLQIFVENKSIRIHLLKKFEVEGQQVVAIHVEASTLREMNFGDFKSEHETWGVSKEKLSCSMVKTLSTVSRVGALGLCFAIGFSR